MVNKQKILIVDDDENIAELISLYLTSILLLRRYLVTAENRLDAGNHLLSSPALPSDQHSGGSLGYPVDTGREISAGFILSVERDSASSGPAAGAERGY